MAYFTTIVTLLFHENDIFISLESSIHALQDGCSIVTKASGKAVGNTGISSNVDVCELAKHHTETLLIKLCIVYVRHSTR